MLLADQITGIANEVNVQTSKFTNVESQIKQIWVILTHLNLWAVVARHNFRRVKFKYFNLAL